MDLRDPKLHELFSEEANPGVAEILKGDSGTNIDFSRYRLSNGIHFIPGGRPPVQPVDLLDSSHLKAFFSLTSSEFDIIFLDAPPVLALPDTAIISRMVDGVILVLHSGKTKTSDLIQARNALEKSGGCEIIGVVMNHFSEKNPDDYNRHYRASRTDE